MSRPAARGALGAWLAGRVARGAMPGAAWSVDGPDGPLDRGVVGTACLEPRTAATLATPWDLASLTKALATAPLLLLARQAGRLDLDDTAGDHVAELAGSRWAATSLRALATHTSGLPAWEPFYCHGTTLAGYLARVRDLPAGPVGRVEYSDPGYLVLGVAVERAWGAPLDRLFAEHLARPLGLARAGFATAPDAWSDAAATERGNAFERRLAGDRGAAVDWPETLLRGVAHDRNARTLGGVAGHAGLFATLPDVVTLARALADPAGPLDAAARRAWLEADPAARTRTVGLVTAAGSRAARGALPDAAPGHTGFTGTSCWLDPDTGRSYVLLTNRVHPGVPDGDFQPLRHEFHRRARALRDPG